MQTPDGRTQQARRRTQDGASLLEFADTTQSGVYAARFGPPIDRSLLFAVNVDTVESDLAQISPDELQTDVWPGVAFLHQTAWQNAGRPAIASLACRRRLAGGIAIYGFRFIIPGNFFGLAFRISRDMSDVLINEGLVTLVIQFDALTNCFGYHAT